VNDVEIVHPWAEAPWVAASAEEQAKRDAEDAEWDRLAGAIARVAIAVNQPGRLPAKATPFGPGHAIMRLPGHPREEGPLLVLRT
jgi:hypothetical protein